MITLMIRISKEVVTSAQKSYGSTGRARALAAVRPPVMRSLGRSAGLRKCKGASCLARIENYMLGGTHTASSPISV